MIKSILDKFAAHWNLPEDVSRLESRLDEHIANEDDKHAEIFERLAVLEAANKRKRRRK